MTNSDSAPSNVNTEKLLTLPESASRLRITVPTLRRYIKQGLIQVVRFTPGKLFITPEEIDLFIDRNTGTFSS